MTRKDEIDYASGRNALKRGGGESLQNDNAVEAPDPVPEVLVTLNAALERLEEIGPRQARVIEHNPFRAGLDHVALACESEEELERVAAALAAAGVDNTGVKRDPTLGKRYVAFKDPDRIAWELYMV